MTTTLEYVLMALLVCSILSNIVFVLIIARMNRKEPDE